MALRVSSRTLRRSVLTQPRGQRGRHNTIVAAGSPESSYMPESHHRPQGTASSTTAGTAPRPSDKGNGAIAIDRGSEHSSAGPAPLHAQRPVRKAYRRRQSSDSQGARKSMCVLQGDLRWRHKFYVPLCGGDPVKEGGDQTGTELPVRRGHDDHIPTRVRTRLSPAAPIYIVRPPASFRYAAISRSPRVSGRRETFVWCMGKRRVRAHHDCREGEVSRIARCAFRE